MKFNKEILAFILHLYPAYHSIERGNIIKTFRIFRDIAYAINMIGGFQRPAFSSYYSVELKLNNSLSRININ